MTQLCYTLEEAAARLNLSETVLVRLSQYFKVPAIAYEAVGYLSFKGDLTFSDQDIDFFNRVRERLLLGESLDEVKSRIRQDASVSPGVPPVADRQARPNPDVTSQQEFAVSTETATAAPMALPLRDVRDERPYKEAATESFERYKSKHRTGLGRVFRNMIKEIGVTPGLRASHAPEFRPLRGKVYDQEQPLPPASDTGGEPRTASRSGPQEAVFPAQPEPKPAAPLSRPDSVLPFRSLRQRRLGLEPDAPASPRFLEDLIPEPPKDAKRHSPKIAVHQAAALSEAERRPREAARQAASDESWEPLIHQAVSHPRPLNTHLKNAASLLRDRALNSPPGQDKPGGKR